MSRRWRRHPREVADVGLQAERTYLAWQRSGLAFAGSGALLIHGATHLHGAFAAVPGLFGLGVGAGVLTWSQWRYGSAVEAAQGRRDAAAPGMVLLLAVAATALGLAGLVLIVLTRP